MDEKEKAAARAEAAEHLVKGGADRPDRMSALIRFLSAAARREQKSAEVDQRDHR